MVPSGISEVLSQAAGSTVVESSHAGDAWAVGRTVETAKGEVVLVVVVAVVTTADGLAVSVLTLADVVGMSLAAGACAATFEPFELQPLTTTADAAKSTNPTSLLTATAIPSVKCLCRSIRRGIRSRVASCNPTVT